MGRFSRSRRTAFSRSAFDRDETSPERDRRSALGFIAALPALVLASTVASLVGMG